MALDSITIHHLIKELFPLLIDTRIDRIQQPEKEEVHLLLRGRREYRRLLINAGSTAPRIHLTDQTKKNPAHPPMFCMILRKHLEGGKITDLRQLGLDRIILFNIQNHNEKSDLQDYHLYLEIMGKHSNLILVNPQSNTILDGLRRYSSLLSKHREVLPGREYILPPTQDKTPVVDNEQDFTARLLEYPLDRKVKDALVALFQGLSPELAKEIVLRAKLDLDEVLDNCGDIDLSRLFQVYAYFLRDRDTFVPKPGIYYTSKLKTPPYAFSLIPYEQYFDCLWQPVPSLNDAIRIYYEQKTAHHQNEARRGSLLKVVRDQYQRSKKKQGIYQNTITKAEKELKAQKFGELLTANLYKLTPRMTEITVEDYTDPDLKPLTIPLDPALSGAENAQRYFKQYNKAKSAIKKTKPFLDAVSEEVLYLQSLLSGIEQAEDETELDEIYTELVEQGYIADKNAKQRKRAGSRKRKEEERISQPHRYISKTGKTIIVGRNNKQNDRLTLKEAKPTDLWLHVKDIPGAHVIVPLNREEEFPDEQTLLEAAALAAYFSPARYSSNIPVDYTRAKYVKKPRGAKPGMVIYEQNKTLFVTAKQEEIDRLLATKE
ncbi:MAG: Rqc2 family fibronectin-binding protein [Desulfitobacteriia bacterium]|jgi:predicted ribosome quality control (RQC) complex YloA/Tae2 family protein